MYGVNEMPKRLVVLLSAIAVVTMLMVGPSQASSYYMWDTYGSTYSDAQKIFDGNDDELCWAAAASNILLWTGWSQVLAPAGYNFSTAQGVFQYFIDHWTNVGGNTYFGVEWWFTGNNGSEGWAGWSQVDVAGGDFWSQGEFDSNIGYDTGVSVVSNAVWALDQGMGVELAVKWFAGGGHAITLWGYDYTESASGLSIDGFWFTESDSSSLDGLQYMSVYWSATNSRWESTVLGHGCYLGDLVALDRYDGGTVVATPEPSSFLLIFIGIMGLAGYRRMRA